MLVREAQPSELTLPGFVHDLCSAVHPMAVSSPLFRSLPLAAHGLEWIEPPLALAYPFDDAPAAVLERDLERTAVLLVYTARRRRCARHVRISCRSLRPEEHIRPPRRNYLKWIRFQ